jgi:hypothetical protein
VLKITRLREITEGGSDEQTPGPPLVIARLDRAIQHRVSHAV